MKQSLELISKLNYHELTPIQVETIKAFVTNKHIVGVAPTGTGKTLAYLMPIIQKLDYFSNEVQLVIMVPTNELVIQVTRMLKNLDTPFSIKSYYGGLDKKRELTWLKKNQPQIVIATPLRIEEFAVNENALKIHTTKYLVLDEADMMFDEKFMKMIDTLMSSFSKTRFLLYSASITNVMQPFINKYFGEHIFINTNTEHQLKIEHHLVRTRFTDRLEVYQQVIKSINPFLCIIFVSRKDDLEKVYQTTREINDSVVKYDTALPMRARKKIFEDVVDLKYQFVVATDLAARGLDFKASHIINYDLPYHLEYFMHRSGRTGRMNTSGIVITIMEDRDRRKITLLSKQGVKFKEFKLSSSKQLEEIVPKPTNVLSEAELKAIKKIPKPTRVSPNYRKKNKAKIMKAKKEARRNERRASNR